MAFPDKQRIPGLSNSSHSPATKTCRKRRKQPRLSSPTKILSSKLSRIKQRIPGLSNSSHSPATKTCRKRRKQPRLSSPTKMLSSKLSIIKKSKTPMKLKKQNEINMISAKLIVKPKRKLIGPYEGQYKCLGLSPKEKMHIIGNCQSRSTRYAHLKQLAADAINNDKIFSVFGSCKTVRSALVERGWVEKLPVNRMNMKNIHSGRMNKHEIRNELETLLLSHFVEKYAPSFIWCTKEHNTNTIDMTADYIPTVNKLQVDAQWTTKQGLCATMKRNYWFYIEGVAEVFCPRTYNSYDPSEIDSFKNDFKITACTSLLKWVLSMVADHRPVFVSTGTVSINVMLFAVNRCKEYLYRKQNKDIDKTLSNVSTSQWNTFMKNYYRIISRTDHFRKCTDKELNLYLCYVKFLLREIHKYRPQLSCEGCHNIWIIKPAHCCRGRGIRLASKLEVVDEVLNKAKAKYVVQKYIEEPLLIHETKFDIRQYYLITSTCPLVIWMYKDCYLKFSTQKYNLKNYHESIHLTNNAVQKKYKNCENRHEELPLYNMWDSDKYISYLKSNGKEHVWDEIIYPGMKKAIVSIVLGCQDSMVACKNRFELYGCDFLLDKEYKPWLIEINSCPDLNHTTPVTAKICPAVVKDIIKVVLDYTKNPSSSTGKFECIYRQPYTIPKYPSVSADLTVHGYSLPSSYFYKGKYEFMDPLHNTNVVNEVDITAVMKMLKTDKDKKNRSYEIYEFPDLPQLENQSPYVMSEARLSTTCVAKELTSVIDKVVSALKIPPVEANQNYIKNSDSDATDGQPTDIVTDCSLSDQMGVDLSPLEDTLIDLSPSTKKLNPLIYYEYLKLNAAGRHVEYKDAASQAVFNLLAYLNRKEREERDSNKFHQIKFKGS